MDIFEFVRIVTNKLRLIILYFRRILFAKNNFKVPISKKLLANLAGGFLADQWVLYDLDLKKKKDYLSEFDWYKSRYINAPFDIVLNNKVIATEVLKKYVKVPEIYVVKNRLDIFDYEGKKLSLDDVVEIIKEKKNLFIKPYGKGKGVGVNHILYKDKDFYWDNEIICLDILKQRMNTRKEWYLSETIYQNEYGNSLYNRTINTIRIITLRDPKTQKFKNAFAVQRIGTSKTIPVDNASRGGIVCRIDMKTGKLSEGRTLHSHDIYIKHPDSGLNFENTVVPEWNKIKDKILNLSNKFPYFYFIAWDIVITRDNEICIVEANTSSGVNIIQLWGGQRNGELGEFYKYHHIIK